MPTPIHRRWRTTPATTELAKALRKAMTPAEKRLWAKLRNNQLDGLHIRRQEPVDRFIADFLHAPSQLVIETTRHRNRRQCSRRAGASPA
jgi:very-short-patch-repair endonuclease